MAKHEPADVRRQQLFMAALEVVGERGYHRTRVDDIVARAGLSKGALYHQFSSKQDLFLTMFREMMEQYRDRMLEALEQIDEAEAAFRLVYDEFVQHFEHAPHVAKGMLEFYLISTRDEEIRGIFRETYQELAEVAARIIDKGIEQGEFSADVSPREVAWTFMTAGDGLILVHMGLDMAERGFETCRTLLDIMLRGMRAHDAAKE